MFGIFLYRLVDRSVVHSFPTRRSSDLTECFCYTLFCRTLGAKVESQINLSVCIAELAFRGGTQGLGLQTRSEEHTSELQSPCNLVCRLLLEKKKQQCGRMEYEDPWQES